MMFENEVKNGYFWDPSYLESLLRHLIKKETEELLETTKLAVHNFKETYESRRES